MSKISHLDKAWFVPSTNEELSIYIDKKVKELNLQKKESTLPIVGLIVPHAGYAYALDTAIEGYGQLNKNNYDRVIILSPSHRFPLFEKVVIEPINTINTVCGEIDFDEEMHEVFSGLSRVIEDEQASLSEHSIHIHLPLIRHFLGDIPVMAMMFGKWNYNQALENFAEDIYDNIQSLDGGIERTLFIISSDFTHYGENFGYFPFNEDIENNLDILDHTIYHAFASHDIALFEKAIEKTQSTVCGATALKFMMTLLPQSMKVEEIAYTNSSKVTNDLSSSVSYLSALIYADWKDYKNGFIKVFETITDTSSYTAEEQQMIVDIAKKSLYYSVENGQAPQINYETIPPKLLENGAVFVTLTKNGLLRGCIGDILPQRPLIDSIVNRAFSAALEDNRFPKVEVQELASIDLEVSVLSPPLPIRSHEDILLGKHGVILKKGKNSAVFLPQVALEQGWTKEEMLEQLSLKAGLEKEDWKAGCDYFVFISEIFKD